MIGYCGTGATDPYGPTTSTADTGYCCPYCGRGNCTCCGVVNYPVSTGGHVWPEMDELKMWLFDFIKRSNRVRWINLRKEIKKIYYSKKVLINFAIINFRMMFSKSGYLPYRIKQKKKG